MQFRIEYSPDAIEQLRGLTARDRALILDTVDKKLAFDATVETRQRRPMRPNAIAPWELRIGKLRVYYDVAVRAEPLVSVRAIGMKVRNTVRIGRKIIRL